MWTGFKLMPTGVAEQGNVGWENVGERQQKEEIWKWKLEIADQDRERNSWGDPLDCVCGALISLSGTKRRLIIRGLSLCRCDSVVLTGSDTPCRLSLISSTTLNQYGHDHEKTVACASCCLGDRDRGHSRTKGWVLKDKMWEENYLKWHLCGRGKENVTLW